MKTAIPCLGLLLATGLAGQDPKPVRVEETHDGRPFTYRVQGQENKAGHRLQRLTFPTALASGEAANDRVPARLYLPLGKGVADRPAVICLHILNGNFELTRMFCAALSTAGIPAMWFPLPWYGERRGAARRGGWLGRPEGFCDSLAQSLADIRRARDLLASRPEVDKERIGISGISLGAILAATGAAAEPRFHRVCLIMGGGGLEKILSQARECRSMQRWLSSLDRAGRERVLARIRSFDPLAGAAALGERARSGRVMMINPARDEVVRPERARELARAMGMADRIRWLPDLGHYTAMAALPAILGEAVSFFAADLPPGAASGPGQAPAPLVRVRRFLRELGSVITSDPRPGRGRFVALEVDLQVQRGPRFKGRASWLRGAAGRFVLGLAIPGLGQARLGGEPALWLQAGKGLFRATGDHQPPLAFASSEHRLKLQVLAGALQGITISTAILQQVIKARALPDGALELDVAGQGRGILRFAADGVTPTALELKSGRVTGRIGITAWNPDMVAPESLFAPPAAAGKDMDPVLRKVPARDLARMVSALFNLVMEKMQ